MVPEGDGRTLRSHSDVDEALREWRQGDCVLDTQWFAYRVSATLPITAAAKAGAEAALDLVEQEVLGFVVLTQTCDIVRSCNERPFLEVCPLVEVAADVLEDIRRARRPSYAFIPSLTSHRLVADLDRVMTVEKTVATQWARVPGWKADGELRDFGRALARKRIRFAFPDDFVALVRPLEKRLLGKHGKNSPEGRALRDLREIRVAASPSWDETEVLVTIHFIRSDEVPLFEGRRWHEFLEAWLSLILAQGRFKEVQGMVITLEGLSAAEYVASDPLDLDHLTLSAEPN